ncbi:LysR family transcriptional regulator [Lacticaseibacillus kribbianus]|uniref:LysR family transcriptional regulator n=1 Tax=Lacticaseibacillus kribbianus TaxID=2926292 RepID=UPI001CD4FA8C|nr:LysR family transcriptional regulator [Lacticaseibacillus kribbianus]
MNTRDLDYFQKLCELKNFSQVAAHFGVTQPTITMALKRLEAHFKIQLIDRDQSHGRVTVTAAGAQLAAHAAVITHQLAVAETELARARTTQIQLGLPPIIGSFYFPRLAPALLKSGLMDQLHTHEAGSDRLLADLRAGHLDVALLGSIGPLSSGPFCLVVAPDHPLAKAGPVAFATLAETPLVSLTEGFVHTKALAWFTKATGVHPRIVYRTPDVAILKQMVKAGVGAALLARVAVVPEDGLVALPLTEPGQPTFDMALVTGAQLVPSPAMQRFLTLVTASKGDS